MIELEKYDIGGEIGRGGVAIVYKARHKVLQTDVAIKVLHKELTHDPEFVKRFINGARSAARLKHPNIIPVFDVGDNEGWYYIVMEFLQGETLKERIDKKGPMPEREIEGIIRPLSAALDYAHEHGTIHRDIKSPNIFMKDDGNVVLMDFDIAKASDLAQNLTQDGSVLGTPAYMSPEQAMGEGASTKSDIYSLGVVMYEMATGTLPFKGENTLSVLRQIAMDNPAPPCEINPVVSKRLQEIILRCMEKSPDKRPENARAIFSEPVHEEPAAKPGAKKVDPGPGREKKQRGEPGRLRRFLPRAVVWLVVLGAAYAAYKIGWPALQRRDFNVVSVFAPGRHYSGILPSPETAPAGLNEVATERVKKLYDEAVSKIDAGEIDAALAKLGTIRDIDPGNVMAQRGMQKAYTWHLENADRMFSNGDYNGYRRYMNKAVEYFPQMKLDNLYQRGHKYFEAARLLGDGEDNAADVYKAISVAFPGEEYAGERLRETITIAMKNAFLENRFREYTDLARGLAAGLPGMASGIYMICGDAYYANNMLLAGDRYSAATMYTRALAADSSNAQAKNQLMLIVAEIRNRLAGTAGRNEKLALIRMAKSNFPDTEEFAAILKDLDP